VFKPGGHRLDTVPEFLIYLWHLAEEKNPLKTLDKPKPLPTIDINTPYDTEAILPTKKKSLSKRKPF
jgi:hypothetical protein